MELLRMIKINTWTSRVHSKLDFYAVDRSIIRDIPTQKYIAILKSLKSEGWNIVDIYYNDGLSLHHSKIKLKNNSNELTLEWRKKYGGSIEGADQSIREIAVTHGFIATDDRHCAQKNRNSSLAA
jgi:hypothetical protein